jgi:asparagine synthase (glutamine-hydrolysing)
MLGAAPHRGSRFRSVANGYCALGVSYTDDHIDVSIGTADGISLALAGRVDNLAQIALSFGGRELDADPARVLAIAFRAHGGDLPNRLRGTYSIIATDGVSLWCFRDHLGLSPLFYRASGGEVYAASEAKQVAAGAEIGTGPDLDVVERIFYGDVDDQTPCALQGVHRLPKSSLLHADGRTVDIRRYWKPEAMLERGPIAADELRPRFEQLMTQAVSRTLTGADVVALSGGIDSPAVAAFAVQPHLQISGNRLAALSTVYPDLPSVDERGYIELVADRLGLPLHLFAPTSRPLDGLADWVRLADGPFPTTSLAEAAEFYGRARALGFRTILTGELAEFVVDMDADLLPHLLWRGRFGAVVRYVGAERSRGIKDAALARRVASAIAPEPVVSAYRQARGRRRSARRVDWVDAPPRSDEARIARRDRWRAWQAKAFVGPGISGEADEVAQAVAGVVVRRPWADIDLWEFFLRLPAQTKFPSGRRKGLVRALLRGHVPNEILDRRGKTFFDEAIRTRIDYAELRRWLVAPAQRIRGVDYEMLAERLRAEHLDLTEFMWARDLAAVHAFLAQW